MPSPYQSLETTWLRFPRTLPSPCRAKRQKRSSRTNSLTSRIETAAQRDWPELPTSLSRSIRQFEYWRRQFTGRENSSQTVSPPRLRVNLLPSRLPSSRPVQRHHQKARGWVRVYVLVARGRDC